MRGIGGELGGGCFAVDRLELVSLQFFLKRYLPLREGKERKE